MPPREPRTEALAVASRALAAGDPLAALRLLALREDPFALALRGLALAQLGDFARARQLLERAARAFERKQPLAHARCAVALAEIALANRELRAPRDLPAALATLERHGDRANALHARLIALRRLVLLGRTHEVEAALAALDLRGAPSTHAAIAALIDAETALRSLRAKHAARALARARRSARQANIPALIAEVDALARLLQRPAARAIVRGEVQPLTLAQVEQRLRARGLIVDACRRSLHCAGRALDLRRRPVLFVLARSLAEAAPAAVTREQLLAVAFGVTRVNDAQRLRLRVEVARLRKLMAKLAEVRAAAGGFQLVPLGREPVMVLAPPVDGEDAAVLALLGDGAAWSSAALALALGTSQRSVQRVLTALESQGRIRGYGRARARRWTSNSEIATALLLPIPRAPS